MTMTVGVKFRRHGPLNYYSPGDGDPPPGTKVVAEVARGLEIGEVVMAAADLDPSMLPNPLPPLLREATPEDLLQRASLDSRLPEAMRLARELVEERHLPVKIARAEISFDGARILFDLTAERQTQYQDLAKEQGLPLNPTRLNGMCGKLKCCLQYENEQYVDLKRRLPKAGAQLQLADGAAVITEISLVREQVLVTMTESGTVMAIPAADLMQEPRAADEGAGQPRRRHRRGAAPRD